MAQEHILIVTLLPLCLVLVGTSVGLMIGACINNKKYKHIMDTQQEIIAALNVALLPLCLVLVGTSVGLMIGACINNKQYKHIMDAQQEIKDALATSVAEGDAKVDDAPAA